MKKWELYHDWKARTLRRDGLSIKDIAKELGFTPRVVGMHLRHEPMKPAKPSLTLDEYSKGRAVAEAGGSYDDIAKAAQINLQQAVRIFKPFL